jgi:N-acetylglucosaminyldiphosphoundecaprenol N-acetyl-beta-D-mannosaminyltransferase
MRPRGKHIVPDNKREGVPLRGVRIGSLRLNACGADEAIALVAGKLGRPADGSTCFGFLNPHVYNHCVSDRRVAAFIERCDAVCLDGVGIEVAGSIENRAWLPRVAMYRVFDAAIAAGLVRGRVVMLGLGSDDCALARRNLMAAAPFAEFVACHDGFLDEREYVAILREHRDADFVLVGMGTPRSEYVLSLASDICDRAFCWHVGGGSLRQWAGTKRRAPALVSRLGLEWLHRMAFEPQTRSRYVAGIPLFLFRLTMDILRRRGAPEIRSTHPREHPGLESEEFK